MCLVYIYINCSFIFRLINNLHQLNKYLKLNSSFHFVLNTTRLWKSGKWKRTEGKIYDTQHCIHFNGILIHIWSNYLKIHLIEFDGTCYVGIIVTSAVVKTVPEHLFCFLNFAVKKPNIYALVKQQHGSLLLDFLIQSIKIS